MAIVSKKYLLLAEKDKKEEQLKKYNAKAQELYNKGFKAVKMNLVTEKNALYLSYEGK